MNVLFRKTYWCSCRNTLYPHFGHGEDGTKHKKGNFCEYKLSSIEFCCAKMEEAFEERFVVFGEFDSILNEDANVNIIRTYCYPEGAVFEEMSIERCPFCGSKIETTDEGGNT